MNACIRRHRRAALMMALAAAATSLPPAAIVAQQDSAEWLEQCREGSWRENRARFCEIRELTLRPPGRALDVDGRKNGGIAIHAWDGDSVLLRALIQTSAGSERIARELASEIRIVQDGARIYAEGPALERDDSWSVSYEIHVPRRFDLTLETRNGPISVRGVTGSMQLRAQNGPIVLRGLGGDVRARTQNGPLAITLEGTQWQGTGLDAETTTGPVVLTVPEKYSARLETGTRNGPTSIDFPLTIQGRFDPRRISVDLGSGGPPVRAVTVNGPVTLRRP